jgi:hypothetical protein
MIVRLRNRAAARDESRQALMREVRVRHRAPGHVRFDLPAALCAPGAAEMLERALRRVEGVYRVTLFAGMGKLSIRWAEEVCTLAQVVRALSGAVEAVADGGVAAPEAVPQGLVERIKSSGPVARLRDRYRDLKAKAVVLNQIMAIKTGGKVAMPFDAKDWALHFANDLVVYYLIRTHWDRIMRQWLPQPWTYRYQWATVVYLVFLLVRFRKARK